MQKVKLVQVGKETSNKNFIHKIVVDKSVEVLGVTKIAKLTYYIALPAIAGVEGTEYELDFNLFSITERPFAHPETGEQLMLKWLHIK